MYEIRPGMDPKLLSFAFRKNTINLPILKTMIEHMQTREPERYRRLADYWVKECAISGLPQLPINPLNIARDIYDAVCARGSCIVNDSVMEAEYMYTWYSHHYFPRLGAPLYSMARDLSARFRGDYTRPVGKTVDVGSMPGASSVTPSAADVSMVMSAPAASSGCRQIFFDNTCVICLDTLSDSTRFKPVCVTHCGHVFHDSCLQLAFSSQTGRQCPTCKRPVL